MTGVLLRAVLTLVIRLKRPLPCAAGAAAVEEVSSPAAGFGAFACQCSVWLSVALRTVE